MSITCRVVSTDFLDESQRNKLFRAEGVGGSCTRNLLGEEEKKEGDISEQKSARRIFQRVRTE